MNKFTRKHVLIFTALFIVFMIVVLPLFAKQMNEVVGDVSSPDTSLWYSSYDLYWMAFLHGVEGRSLYITQRFSFDLIWPIVYGLFMLSAVGYGISNYKFLNANSSLKYIPILAVVFDYLENIFASIVFYRFPDETHFIAEMTPVFTLMKWIYVGLGMLLAISIIVYMGIEYIKEKRD